VVGAGKFTEGIIQLMYQRGKSSVCRFTNRESLSSDFTNAESEIRNIDEQLSSSTDHQQRATLFLGKSYYYGLLRNFEDARKALRLAVEESANDPDVLFESEVITACLYDQEGLPNEALPRLTALLTTHRERLMRSEFRDLYEDLQVRRALDLVWMRHYQEAVTLVHECLSFKLPATEKSTLLSNLGYSYFQLRNYDSARTYLQQACEFGLTKEWEGHVHSSLAVAYAHLDLLAESKREFQICETNAVSYGLALTTIYKWLEGICLRLGQNEEAKHYAMLNKPS